MNSSGDKFVELDVMGLKSSQEACSGAPHGLTFEEALLSHNDDRAALDFFASSSSKDIAYADKRRHIIAEIVELSPDRLPSDADKLFESAVAGIGKRIGELTESTAGLKALSRSDAPSCSSPSSSSPDQLLASGKVQAWTPPLSGRLGPALVQVDRSSTSGQLAYGPSGLLVESLANFSSLRGTACVFTGRWQYEVTLHTAGIVQVRWEWGIFVHYLVPW